MMNSASAPKHVSARGPNALAAGHDVAFNAIGANSRVAYIENLFLDAGTANQYTLSSMQPPAVPRYTPRTSPEAALRTALEQSLSGAENVVSIEGIGGSGKTALAAAVLRDPRVVGLFPGGVYWMPIGRERTGERLASYLCEVVQALTGTHFAVGDVQLASSALVDSLATREAPSLLVLDDVWGNDQIRNLLRGGPNITRLALSRNRLDALAGAVLIELGMMSREEAIHTLFMDLAPSSRRAIEPTLLEKMVIFSHCWPVLLTILNAALRENVRQGAVCDDVVNWVLDLLSRGGPSALDGTLPISIEQSVQATLTATLTLLGDDSGRLFEMLCIFEEDAVIPDHLVEHYWTSSGGSSPEAASAILGRLTQLRLLDLRWSNGKPGRILHDVIRDYLIHQSDRSSRTDMNSALIASWREQYLTNSSPSEWWTVPLSEQFIYQHLCTHLSGADLLEERKSLLHDLRWHASQISSLGSTVPSVADLREAGDATSLTLESRLASDAALFQRESSPGGLASTLLARIASDRPLAELTQAFASNLEWPTLRSHWKLDDVAPQELSGHLGPVGDLALSPNGQLLASVSDDRTGLLWDITKGTVIRRFLGHTERVRSCSFSPSGRYLLTSGMDGSARIWDVGTGVSLLVTGRDGFALLGSCWAPSGDRIAGSFSDGKTLVWDATTGDVVATLSSDDTGGTWDCAFSEEGFLITGGDDGHIRKWAIADSVCVMDLRVHERRIRRCSVSRDGQRALSASSDSTASVIDLVEREVVGYLVGHKDRLRSACFSPSGQAIITASEDRSLRVWNASSFQETHCIRGHTDWVGKAAFCDDELTLVSCGGDATVRFWLLKGARQAAYQTMAVFARGGDDTPSCCFSSDGSTIYFGKVDTTRARRIDGNSSTLYSGHSGRVLSAAASGNFLYTAGSDGRVISHELNGSDQRSSVSVGSRVWSLAVSRDGSVVASAAEDGIVRLHSSESLLILRQSSKLPGHLMACAIDPTGGNICYVGDDANLHVSDINLDSQKVSIPVPGTRSLWCCSYSHRGDHIAVAGEPGTTASIYEAKSGALASIIHPRIGRLTSIGYSCDDRFLATCGDDGYVGIWDPLTGAPITGLRFNYPLRRIAWSPTDPHLLAVAGTGGEYLLRLTGIPNTP